MKPKPSDYYTASRESILEAVKKWGYRVVDFRVPEPGEVIVPHNYLQDTLTTNYDFTTPHLILERV